MLEIGSTGQRERVMVVGSTGQRERVMVVGSTRQRDRVMVVGEATFQGLRHKCQPQATVAKTGILHIDNDAIDINKKIIANKPKTRSTQPRKRLPEKQAFIIWR